MIAFYVIFITRILLLTFAIFNNCLAVGEMLTGPAKALFMDEISTGLDSSSTFQIVKYIRQMVHVMNYTVMISLLQSPPWILNDLSFLPWAPAMPAVADQLSSQKLIASQPNHVPPASAPEFTNSHVFF